MKIYWDIKSERQQLSQDSPHFEPNDYFGVSVKDKQPAWYAGLTMFEHGFKSKIELLKNKWDLFINARPDQSFKTAKGCPAFINFFKQSIALKTPTDIYIEIYQDEETEDWMYKWRTADRFWTVSGHSDSQVGDIGQHSMVLKFSHELMWMADEDCQFQYIDPFITNMVHYRVCPGVIHLKKGSVGSFNMPVFFAKRAGQFYIPAGTTMAYVQFDKPIRKFIRKDMTKQLKKAWYKIFVKGDHSEHIGK